MTEEEATADGWQDATASAALATPPDDPQQLKEEIERTREQLGATVEALAAKADVRARAKDKASQVAGRAKSKASQARQQAAAQTGVLRAQLASQATRLRHKAQPVTGPANGQIQSRASLATAAISKAIPEPVRNAARKAGATAQQRRLPLAVAASAAVLACLAIVRWRRR